jgi:hypothetical protein
MDIDIDFDEGQVDTWSGGISDGIPKTWSTVAPEADDHKESLHFFPNNQQVTVRLIQNQNILPDGALTDDVLDTINTTHDLRRFLLSYHTIKRFSSTLTSSQVAHPACKTVVNASSKTSVSSKTSTHRRRKGIRSYSKE